MSVKRTIILFLKKILYLLPLKRTIIFESCPDFSDNTFPVFEELIKRGVNKKYKMIWMTHKEYSADIFQTENVEALYPVNHKYKTFFLNHLSKVVICSNYFYGSDNKRQISFYLMHGTPLKNVKSYYNCPKHFNYMITSGKGVNELCSYQFNYPINKTIPLGYPRNDDLIRSNVDLAKLFGNYRKYIVWYPTVKQFTSGRLTGSIQPIPIIHDDNAAFSLNELANKLDIIIIIKPHFAQVSDNIKRLTFSNLIFIDDNFFVENCIKSYDFVGSCDALLTDYSSIYFDFLLKDKPIGLILEDYDEYKKNPGIIDEFEKFTAGGEKIFNIFQLKDFIERISNDVDLLRNERFEISKLANFSNEASNAKRVVDFIIEKAKL